jgi:hypothetical protein
MTRVAQKTEELAFLGEFLRSQLKLNVTELKPAVREPPDCSADITDADGTTLLLDFEIAEYYVDIPGETKSGSPTKRASDFWSKVMTAVNPRFEDLGAPADIHVTLKNPAVLKNKHARPLAEELIRFGQELCPKVHLERARYEEFSADSHPLLHEHVESIVVTRLEGTVLYAYCSNLAAANIGVDPAFLGSQIRQKSGKQFTWTAGAEKCLLIYASGGTSTSRAGPYPRDPSVWSAQDLVAACQESVFDRVYFWERVRGWERRLK